MSERLACLALAAVLAFGCALMKPADVETRKEMLSKVPEQVPQSKPHAATLLVFPPETEQSYDTTQMAYSTRDYQLGYFSRTEWGDKPGKMIHPLLVQTLEKTRYFSAVVAPPHIGRYTHSLRTEIVELKQDHTVEPPALSLRMRIQLGSEDKAGVIATKEITIREPLAEKTPHGGVVAANDAVAKALQEAARFVLEKLG